MFIVRKLQGGPSSVQLRCVRGTVRAVPVFGSIGSFGPRVPRYFSRLLIERFGSSSAFASSKTVPAVPVPLSVPGKRF